MNRYDIIIIGAGPAGLFCALNCGGGSVLVLEKTDSAGKKLLLSGSGQCNITHTGKPEDFLRHYGTHGDFVKPALRAFGSGALVAFLGENGIATAEREDGKIFPAGKSAREVLSLLLRLCRENGVEIRCGERVMSVAKDESAFLVETAGGEYASEFLIIAAGGNSYPATGSGGDGYPLAKSLGHTIIPITPALAPVHIRDFAFARLSGISVRASAVSLFREERKIASGKGDLLFTERGLSGPVILDLCRYIQRGDVLKAALVPVASAELDTALAALLRTEGRKSIASIVRGFDIPGRLSDSLLEAAGIDPRKKGSEVSRTHRKDLVRLLSEFPFTVDEKGGYRIAMATSGGVSLDEIGRRTMESKLCEKLYFAGEVMDVDGDTGGYNLQWAFSSGKAAAEGIKKKRRNSGGAGNAPGSVTTPPCR